MVAGKFLIHILLLSAAVIPFLKDRSSNASESLLSLSAHAVSLINAHSLHEASLTEKELQFRSSFPGQVRRFTNSNSEFIFRTVSHPTRLLHPSTDCFRGLGYQITPLPVEIDQNGLHWSCFKADKSGLSLRVCEHIAGAKSGHWPDVSSWFWSATFQRESGPWTAVTRAEISRGKP